MQVTKNIDGHIVMVDCGDMLGSPTGHWGIFIDGYMVREGSLTRGMISDAKYGETSGHYYSEVFRVGNCLAKVVVSLSGPEIYNLGPIDFGDRKQA